MPAERMRSRETMTAKKLNPLTMKAVPVPAAAMRNPAIAGR